MMRQESLTVQGPNLLINSRSDDGLLEGVRLQQYIEKYGQILHKPERGLYIIQTIRAPIAKFYYRSTSMMPEKNPLMHPLRIHHDFRKTIPKKRNSCHPFIPRAQVRNHFV